MSNICFLDRNGTTDTLVDNDAQWPCVNSECTETLMLTHGYRVPVGTLAGDRGIQMLLASVKVPSLESNLESLSHLALGTFGLVNPLCPGLCKTPFHRFMT